MTDPIREQLIGYLLGADEPSEHALVKEHLERDESLRRDLEVLRRGIDPLAADQAGSDGGADQHVGAL